jgi:hypothetical protein
MRYRSKRAASVRPAPFDPSARPRQALECPAWAEHTTGTPAWNSRNCEIPGGPGF